MCNNYVWSTVRERVPICSGKDCDWRASEPVCRLRELADRLGGEVSAQAISKYENGKMFPSSSVLVALGKALDVSLDFLMSHEVVELSGVEFRQHSGVTAGGARRAESAVIDEVERHLALDEILELPPEEKCPAPNAHRCPLDGRGRRAGQLA